MSHTPSGGDVVGPPYSDKPSSTTPSIVSNLGSQPPYPAPADVEYPDHTIENPHVSDMRQQPVFSNIPAGSLFRPVRLPADMEIRLDKASVWMGLDKTEHKAVYFLPPMCAQCTAHTGANCDRGYPTCQRCHLKGMKCEPGSKWGQLKLKAKRKSMAAPASAPAPSLTAENLARVSGAREGDREMGSRTRYSAAEKGKGRARAVAFLPHHSPEQSHDIPIDYEYFEDGARSHFNGDTEYPRQDDEPFPHLASPAIPITGGRGKRTKKKRRLSADEEIDPELLDDEGNLLPPKRRKTPPPEPETNPDHDQRHYQRIPMPTEWLTASSQDTVQDAEYWMRIDNNNRKLPLKRMRAACPAWATTRRALQSGAEYFRDPTKIEGGSVEVGIGGVARGLILEGKSVGGGNYWGTRAAAGSIVVSLGSPRERRAPNDVTSENGPSVGRTRTQPSNPSGSSLPPINILPTTIFMDKNGSSPISSVGSWAEEPEIEALLLAQRARVPMAMAVAQDYPEPPFKVPRAFVVLGWFWLTDAWLEPENLWEPGTQKSRQIFPDEIQLIRWKFRFEWCRGVQGVPWWSPNDDPTRPPTPYVEYKFTIEPLAISGPGIHGSSSVIPASKKAVTDHRTACEICGMVSEAVYKDAKVCLNEVCEGFFMPNGAAGGAVGLDPISKTPATLRPVQRKVPEFLGLRLRGYDPHATSEEGLDRHKLGSDFWQGWVCGKCGMANERRRWSGWDCDGCKHHIAPIRKPISPESLCHPHRAVNKLDQKSPRKDIGYPSFPRPLRVTTASTIYEHHIKVIKHDIQHLDIDMKLEMYHALHARKDTVVDVATRVWKELQGEGGEEKKGAIGGLLRREMMMESSNRPAERYHSAFYTLALGPRSPSIGIMGLPPVLDPVPWYHAPPACLDAMDLINFRAGCMFPGLSERFNSLLIAVAPPPIMSTAPLSITIQPGDHLALLILGSEGIISIRPAPPIASSLDGPDSSTMIHAQSGVKSGSVVAQHGDVVGFLAEKGALEISVQMEVFGMVCFGQEMYSSTTEPGLGAFTLTSDKDPQPLPDPSDPTAISVLGDIDINTIPAVPPPPPKSTVFAPAPLTDWYIGHRPLDINQPLRIHRPARKLPDALAARERDRRRMDEESFGNDEPLEADQAILDDDGNPILDIDVDPTHGNGFIVIENDDDDQPIPDPPEVLFCDIPPSPTIAPINTATKRRAAAVSTAAKAGTVAGEDGAAPAVPRVKRKYVFKDKPVVPAEGDEEVEEVGEGAEGSVVTAVSASKARAKPRGSAGRIKRVSDIGGQREDGEAGPSSSPAGTPGGVAGSSSTDSPVHLKGRWAGRPIKPPRVKKAARAAANGNGRPNSAEKPKVVKKRKGVVFHNVVPSDDDDEDMGMEEDTEEKGVGDVEDEGMEEYDV